MSLFFGAVLLFSHSFVSDSLVTPWTVARQAPLSIGFSRQSNGSGLPFPTSGFDLGMKPASHTLQVYYLPLSPRKAKHFRNHMQNSLGMRCHNIFNFLSLSSINTFHLFLI